MKSLITAAVLWAGLMAGPAHAQQPAHAPAATMPSPGVWSLRAQARYHEFEDQDRTIDHGTMEVSLSHGIMRDVSTMVHIPYRWRDDDDQSSEDGLGDITAMGKWRFYKHDTSPIDTFRMALLGGLELPTGEGAFSSDSLDPSIGLAMTTVRGRHGIGGSIQWEFNTGNRVNPVIGGDSDADALWLDSSYLYRLAPAAYGLNSTASWYAVLESNALFETNGDAEIKISPGILYEAATWAVECQLEWAAVDEVDHRPSHRFGATFGVRWLH